MIKSNIAFCFIFFLLGVSLSAQSKKAILHINQPYYVTGETMWYRVYLPKGFTGIKGKAKVLVKGSNNNVIGDYFVEQKDLGINGYFKIPFDIPSDLYNFAIYVLENQTLDPIELVSFDVPIYNDLSNDALVPAFPQLSSRSLEEINNNDQLQLEVQLDNNQYSIGDKISLEAQVTDQSGNSIPSEYSIAVIDQGLLGSSSERYCTFSEEIQLGFNTVIGMDDRLFVQGNIFDASSNEPAAISIIGAFSKQLNQMNFGKSGKDGKFTILLPEQKGDQSLQIVGYLYDELADSRIEMFQGEPVDRSEVQFTSDFDNDVSAYLEESNKRKRIYQQFKALESSTQFETVENDFLQVRPNKTFRMDEYVDFETVGVFFDEIFGAQLTFEKKGEIYKAQMFNPQKNKSSSAMQNFYFALEPIFIVDGKMTKNADYIYRMPLDQVEEIDLYFDWRDIEKQFGLFGDFGYVVIRSKREDISLPPEDEEDIVQLSTFQPAPQYPVEISNDNVGLPQLKPTVYWHPNLESGRTGKVKTSFSASDDVSNFVVSILARTQDGAILTKQVSYKTAFGN